MAHLSPSVSGGQGLAYSKPIGSQTRITRETYAKRCAELGISPHPRTQPEGSVGEGERYDMHD